MRNPVELIEQLERRELGSPVLLEALDGFIDAGHGVRLSREHLLRAFTPEPIATFDVDALLDYRARRPLLVFDTDHWDAYADPRLAVDLLHDANGTPFLLLWGPEPDVLWERFVAAVVHVIEHLGVRATIGLQAVPWAAPHTRDTGVISHGSPRELLVGREPGVGRLEVPASIGQLLQYRLRLAGQAAAGFAAQVPYYLAQVEYPSAAEALLDAVERAVGVSLSLDPLRPAAESAQLEIDEQLRADERALAVIRELEERYDAGVRDGAPFANEPLPTGEDLGAAFERFLAEQEDDSAAT